ncbi:MAG: VCBS repeat-containing protein, partial [Rhodothermales bacterium]|nr:VCBS repeat-containing protein [Rhodothermales bacterium]
YKGSAGGGEITFFDWGNNTPSTIRPYPGDFDGDGSYDFCIFQDGQYILNRSSDSGVEWINWGLATDAVLAPGDYDGDGQTDFMNVRVSGSDVEWWLLDRTGAQSATVWGAVGIAGFSEFVANGDFDGDGATDIGIWRRDNTSNSNSFFYTLRSSDSMLQTFEWGSMGDAPVPGWNGN